MIFYMDTQSRIDEKQNRYLRRRILIKLDLMLACLLNLIITDITKNIHFLTNERKVQIFNYEHKYKIIDLP